MKHTVPIPGARTSADAPLIATPPTAAQQRAMDEITRIITESSDPQAAAAQFLALIGEHVQPLPPVQITAAGARNPVLTAELFIPDEPDGTSAVSVYSEVRSDADLDVAGVDRLIADLEAALPRLRALRDQLAALKAGER